MRVRRSDLTRKPNLQHKYWVSLFGSTEKVRTVSVDLSSSIEFSDFDHELVKSIADGLHFVKSGKFLDGFLVLFSLVLAGELSGRIEGRNITVECAFLRGGVLT